ncbi:MAG: hypothetical protein II917_00610 [Synergistaceae bacterium]|nr:hypothetical protein [Synergistaceae bacterium]
MTTKENTYKPADIYEKGMSALNSDYTKLHQFLAAAMTPEIFAGIIEESERLCPYTGNAKII